MNTEEEQQSKQYIIEHIEKICKKIKSAAKYYGKEKIKDAVILGTLDFKQLDFLPIGHSHNILGKQYVYVPTLVSDTLGNVDYDVANFFEEDAEYFYDTFMIPEETIMIDKTNKDRYINFQGKISSFDMSDGNGYMPFSMSGMSTFEVKIDGEKYDSCRVIGTPDKQTPYKLVKFVWNYDLWNIFMPKDNPFDIKDYHYENWEDPKKFRVIE